MSSAERHLNQSSSKTQQAIETIYTTVESQPDQTDWMTVVSNLRQINRQLVEQIARLEHSLASSQEALATHKEEKQAHEITILQQQDELKITHERVGALFQQLETSHQIGQRQQILVETLSQQLEISHTVVSQLETENHEILEQSQQQAEKLAKTEEIALELNRRLQEQRAAIETPTPKSLHQTTATAVSATMLNPSRNAEIAEIVAQTNPDPQLPDPFESTVEQNSVQPGMVAPQIIDEELVPIWTPTAPTARKEPIIETADRVETPRNTTVSLPRSTSQLSWREQTPNPKLPTNYKPSESIVSPKPSATPTPPPPAEIANKESNGDETDGTIAKPPLNWPAPTVIKSNSVASKSIVDVPKFPRK